MSTRERPRAPREDRPGEAAGLDDEFGFVSEADIQLYLAEQELEDEATDEAPGGFLNLQTASGMGLIGLGVLYSLQQIGWLPLASTMLSSLMAVLPVLAAVLIILTGFGVLSWSPAARRRRKARERAARLREQARRTMGRSGGRPRAEAATGDQAERVLRNAGRLAGRAASATAAAAGEAARHARDNRRSGRRLTRDYRNRKLTGLAAGLASYFGLDPTIVRMAWVAATIFTSGSAIVPYIILSMIIPKGDEDLDGRTHRRDDRVRITRD